MARQPKKPSDDPQLDRLIDEAKQLNIKSDDIFERMSLLSIKIDAMEGERRAREKKR